MEKLKFDGIIDKGTLESIDITKLMPSPLNSYETDDIEDLRGNIQSCGLITPLTVIGPTENGMYQILSGEKRFKALTQLVADGFDTFRTVPCYVCGNEEMHELEQKLIIESANLEARDQNANEKDIHRLQVLRILKAMNELNDEKHSHIVEVAKNYMGCSKRYRNMYLRVIEEDDKDVYNLINQDKLGVSQADKIFSMNEQDRQEATERIKNGEVAKNVIQEIRDNNKEKVLDELTKGNQNKTSEVAEAILNDEEVSREDVINRFNELADKELAKEVDSPLDKYSEYKPYSSDTSVSDESKANMVMKWCKEMLKKDDYEDFEAEAIDVCRRLVEHYDGL